MIIQSNFHDYYDSASAYGVDPKVRWDRFEDQEEYRKELSLPSIFNKGEYVNEYWLGYCGQLYYYAVYKNFLLNTRSKVEKRLQKMGLNHSTYRKRYVDQVYVLHNTEPKINLFSIYECPIFVLRKSGYDYLGFHYIYINPKLKDTKFSSIPEINYEASQVFQTIFYYVSNFFIHKPETIHIEDKYRMKEKGLDHTSMVGHNQPKKRKRK